MTLVQYNFEGVTAGAALTTANTGATQISAVGGSAVGTATAAHGNIAGSFTGTASNPAIARFAPSATNLTMAMRFYFRLPSLPTASIWVGTLRYSAGAALRVVVQASGVMQISDAAAAFKTTSITVAPNAWYRVETRVVVGTTTSNGQYTVNIYAGDSLTPINTTPYTSSTANLGTTDIVAGDFGQVTTGSAATVLIDDVAYNDGSTSEIGPPPAPPVASFTYNPVGLAVSFDATGSTTTPPATITNYAWVFGDSGTGTGATPSHTYLTAGSYTVGLTVTDSNGGTSSTSQTVGVGGTTSATVASVITSTGWTPVSGTIASVLSDTSLTSLFITSNAYPSNLPLRLKLTGMSAPPTGVGLTVPIAIERSSDSQSASVICKLYDSNGTTLRSTLAAIAVNGVASGTTVDPSNFIEPLFPAADCATVTDWSGVVIELDVTAS